MVQTVVHRSPVRHFPGSAGKRKDARWFTESLRVVVAGGDRKAFPGSGVGNGTSWDNRGSIGNYWSSSWYDAQDGGGLYFSWVGVNLTTPWNNRYHGLAGRPVQHSSAIILFITIYDMILTRQQLLLDLYRAYYDARRHKTKRSYVRQWESGIKDNMERLCRELYDRTYKPQPSKCFIVNYPKKREIFAAMFRDRIVHHLYYNYTSELFGRTFIRDTYSCIKGRGTHDGIARLERFCRKASENWQYKAYALHLDIRGYFIHIDRQRLLEVTLDTLRKMNGRRVSKDGEETWGDVLDMDFVCWMTEQIVTVDPTVDCIVTGDEKDWEGLDPQKSMRNLPPGLGLPIGNLTSQLFSNVFLNRLDQYAKRELGCRYYGRYVDDAIIVSRDKQWLLSLVPVFRAYLRDELGVELHMGKVSVSEVHRGVEFLGAYVKPYRTYVSRRSLERIARNVGQMDRSKPWKMLKSINSYLGMFRHTASYNIRRRMFQKREFLRYGVLDAGLTKMTDRYKFNF